MTALPLSVTYTERVTFTLRQLYQQYGYAQYRMGKFEEYELYARNRSFLVSDHILTFTDTDGKLLALKPDVTLSILKNRPDKSLAPQKVYYNENVYRTASTSHGYREILQLGLESIGVLDDFAVAEVIELAAQSLAAINPGYILDLSHMGVVSGLLDAMDWEDRQEILELIEQKNIPAIQALCEEDGKLSRCAELLCRLIGLYGTPDQVLPELEGMVINETMQDAVAQLKTLCSLLRPYQQNLRLDFSIVNDMNYYNGIIFRGYLPGLASGILAGGQYDNLVQRMGKSGQAIGFAVYMDQLERYEETEEGFDVDVLLLYNESNDPAKVAIAAQNLRAEGNTVRVERTIPVGLRYRTCMEVD